MASTAAPTATAPARQSLLLPITVSLPTMFSSHVPCVLVRTSAHRTSAAVFAAEASVLPAGRFPVFVIYEVATVNATSAVMAVLPLVSSARTWVVYLAPNVTAMNPKLNVQDVRLLHTGAA